MYALVPIKGLQHSKQRLAPLLSPEERLSLSSAMARDVLHTLRASGLFSDILVCSADPAQDAVAREFGARLVLESVLNTSGLNNALNALLARLAASRPIGPTPSHAAAMIVHSDLPLLRAEDLREVVSALNDGDAALVPDRRGRGSNIVMTTLDTPLVTHFGDNSRLQHRQQSRLQGLTLQECLPAGARWDVDLPEDLQLICQHKLSHCGEHTRHYLQGSGIVQRCLWQNAPQPVFA